MSKLRDDWKKTKATLKPEVQKLFKLDFGPHLDDFEELSKAVTKLMTGGASKDSKKLDEVMNKVVKTKQLIDKAAAEYKKVLDGALEKLPDGAIGEKAKKPVKDALVDLGKIVTTIKTEHTKLSGEYAKFRQH